MHFPANSALNCRNGKDVPRLWLLLYRDPSMCRTIHLSRLVWSCFLFIETKKKSRSNIFIDSSDCACTWLQKTNVAHAYARTLFFLPLFIFCSTTSSSITSCLIWHTSVFCEADLWCVCWLQPAVYLQCNTDSSYAARSLCLSTVTYSTQAA